MNQHGVATGGTRTLALAYGTGALTIPQMARAGWWVNVFFVALLPPVVHLFAGRVFTAGH